MVLQIISGSLWGIDKITISPIGETSAPSLLLAESVSPNAVDLIFDHEMIPDSTLLDPENYYIVQSASLERLYVLRALQPDSFRIRLITANQENRSYEVEVSHIRDLLGIEIGSSNTALFDGTNPEFGEASKLYSFAGLYSGIQVFETEDFQPILDPDAPEIVEANPSPDTTKAPRDTLVEFKLIDRENPVIQNTITVFIGGNPAFDGVLGTFISPYNGPGSLFVPTVVDGYAGYRIVLDKTSNFLSYELVEVRVVAADDVGNNLDETYEFRIEDFEPPIFSDLNPSSGELDVDQNISVFLKVYDEGSGVSTDDIQLNVDGELAYNGATDTFIHPYNGPGSALSPTMVGGFDGYDITLDRVGSFPSGSTVTVEVIVLDKEGN